NTIHYLYDFGDSWDHVIKLEHFTSGRDRWPAASNSFQRAVWPHGFGSVCDDRDDGIIMTSDDLRARHELAHDVSHRNDWVEAPE
ncbi:hypothetical protein IVB38_10415, partial [Bradyrhizobium sp. 38]|nr:hypothetical protein [Bradyrhizobium sp. 38]